MKSKTKSFINHLFESRSNDPDLAYREYLLRMVLGAVIVLAVLLTLITLVIGLWSGLDLSKLIALISILFMALTAFFLCEKGHVNIAAYITVSIFFGIGTFASITGNFQPTVIPIYILAILLAGILTSIRIQAILVIAAVTIEESARYFLRNVQIDDVIFQFCIYLIVLFAIAYLQWLSLSQFEKALRRSKAFSSQLENEITERKVIESEKLQLQSYFQTTLKHLQNNVTRYRRRDDGEIIFSLNEGDISKKFGLETAAVFGKSLDETLGSENARAIRPFIEKAFSGEVVNYEGNRDGLYFSTVLSPIEIDGKISEVAGISLDITESRESMEALRLSEQRLRAFIQDTPIGVIEWDLDGRVVSWNPAAEAIFNWTAEEMVGKIGRDFLLSEKRKTGSKERYQNLIDAAQTSRSIGENLTKDGLAIQCEWINSPLKDINGNVIGLISVVQEITARLETERLQKAVYQISDAVATTHNLDELYRSVHMIIGELIPAKNFYIAVFDREKNRINYPYYVDEVDQSPVSRIPTKGLTEYLIRNGKALLVDPKKFDELVAKGEVTSIGSPSIDWMGVPLIDDNQNTFGGIVVQTYVEGERYEKNHLSILQFVSSQVSNAIIRKRAEEKLIESEDRFRSFVEQTSEGVLLLDETGRIVEMNRSLEVITGYPEDEVIGKPGWAYVYELLPEDHKNVAVVQQLRDKYRSLMNSDSSDQVNNLVELPIQRKDGEIRFIQQSLFPIKTSHGYHLGAISRDITEQKLIHNALEENEEKYRTMIERQGEGTGIVDMQEKFIFANPAADRIFGLPSGQLIGRKLSDFMSAEQYEKVLLQTARRNTGEVSTYELDITRADGKLITILVTATPQYNEDNEYNGAFGVFRDITRRKRNEKRLRYMSMHDSLTGVYNRAFFDAELDRIRRGRSFPVSLVVIDLDNLKQVNDKQGHVAGDHVLRMAADLIGSMFRSEDIIARIGGDEFAVILPKTDETTANRLCLRTHQILADQRPNELNLKVEFSCGFATGEKGSDIEKCFQIADLRMFKEKSEKKQNARKNEGLAI